MLNIKSKTIARQFEKPAGFMGSLASLFMVKGNASLYDVIIKDIQNKNQTILEIGFGPGVGINKILDTHNKIIYHGIDFSELMVKKASLVNHRYIQKNRLKLIQADFMEYNHFEIRYNTIIAINVVYFWEILADPFNKVFSLLEEGGMFILFMVEPEQLMKIRFTRTNVFKKYYKSEIIDFLKNAGFKEVKEKINFRRNRAGYFLYAMR